MGYYTSFSLSLYGKPEDRVKAEIDLHMVSEHDQQVEELIKYGSVYAKLYELSAWVEEAAKRNPNVLFVLSGQGEEQDDLWEERYKGYVSERQEAIIPPFNHPELIPNK